MRTRNVALVTLVLLAGIASAANPTGAETVRNMAGGVLPLVMGIGLAFARRAR